MVSSKQTMGTLQGRGVTLRALKVSDAQSLFHHLHQQGVVEHIAPPPPTAEAFVRFIRWTQAQRRNGRQVTYGIVPADGKAAVGIMQLLPIEPDFSTAEWGFVIGSAYWRTGLFSEASHLFLDAVFSTMGVVRLEIRSVLSNVAANRALEKLGAYREGTLRRGFRRNDMSLDQVMWSILSDEWTGRHRDRRHATPQAA